MATVIISNQLCPSYSIVGLLLVVCFYFLLYFKASVSAVSLDVFQSTHCIVYSYCFLSYFEYLLNFLIIIIIIIKYSVGWGDNSRAGGNHNLRKRRHNITLPEKKGHLAAKNFIIRLLYKETY